MRTIFWKVLANPRTDWLNLQNDVGCIRKNMIDRKNRDGLAETFRHLATGRITNDQFEDSDRWCTSKVDPAIHELYYLAAWPLYDDLSEHKLTGRHELTEGMKKDVAHCLLFLKSDYEYEWPRQTGLKSLFRISKYHPWETCGGDHSVWPFFRKSDFTEAKRTHPYMKGTQQ